MLQVMIPFRNTIFPFICVLMLSNIKWDKTGGEKCSQSFTLRKQTCVSDTSKLDFLALTIYQIVNEKPTRVEVLSFIINLMILQFLLLSSGSVRIRLREDRVHRL